MNDADPAADWNPRILKPLCELVVQCLAASPLRRPTTNVLVQKLGLISKIDFRGADYGMDPPGSYDEVLQITSEKLSNRTFCVLCHESVAHSIFVRKCTQRASHARNNGFKIISDEVEMGFAAELSVAIPLSQTIPFMGRFRHRLTRNTSQSEGVRKISTKC
jgi:hypothetical protein